MKAYKTNYKTPPFDVWDAGGAGSIYFTLCLLMASAYFQLSNLNQKECKTSCLPGAIYLLNFPSVNNVHVWASQFSLTFGVLVCFRRPHCIGWDLTANLVEGSGKKHDKASSFIFSKNECDIWFDSVCVFASGSVSESHYMLWHWHVCRLIYTGAASAASLWFNISVGSICLGELPLCACPVLSTNLADDRTQEHVNEHDSIFSKPGTHQSKIRKAGANLHAVRSVSLTKIINAGRSQGKMWSSMQISVLQSTAWWKRDGEIASTSLGFGFPFFIYGHRYLGLIGSSSLVIGCKITVF